MFSIIRSDSGKAERTIAYPGGEPPALPDRFRGLPVLDESKCPDGCRDCAEACPTDAIARDDRGLRLDLGRCLFCTDCVEACPEGAIRYTQDYRLATRHARGPGRAERPRTSSSPRPLDEKMRRLFGRSLKLRQVSAGGDNSAEADLNVLGTVVFDMGRFGIQFVASPRHADGLVVTGPVSENMKQRLAQDLRGGAGAEDRDRRRRRAISGGIFRGHPEVHDGAEGILPVDLYIPGDPPHPLTILDGLLRLLGRIDGPPQR